MTTLWIDPSFGASGDMLLGALVGLGADINRLRDLLSLLPFSGWTIESTAVVRGGLSATRVTVGAPDNQHHRRWSDIDSMMAKTPLPLRVREGARRTFRRLGEIEAAAHSVAIDDVHFHEVGAVDAIIDIVGVWLAVELLGVGEVVSGPVGLGSGTVTSAHGMLPLPAPATAALLQGAPVRSIAVEMETCTPTGAALLATLGQWGPIPDGVMLGLARGAGGRDPKHYPNIISAHIIENGEPSDRIPSAFEVHSVILETNLDDVTPEVIAYVIDRLLTEGADDAWVIPVVMKKSRPGFELRVLCTPSIAGALREIVSFETGTLGIRERPVTKHVATRHVDTIELEGRMVRIKVGPHGAKPEYNDLAEIARTSGRPLRSLAAEALREHNAIKSNGGDQARPADDDSSAGRTNDGS